MLALQGEGPFTVFAPTDAAFTLLLEELDLTDEELLGHPQLAQILLYHVVPGKVMSTDLSDGMTATTFIGRYVDNRSNRRRENQRFNGIHTRY